MSELSRAEFEAVVEEALDSLPKRFADLVANVAISVADEPDDEDFEDAGEDPNDELLGVYHGIALTERMGGPPLYPDEITLFRGPIGRVSRTRSEAIRQVRDTVIHELGHYFGLDEDELP